ncbi:hypothetical protein B0H19DRAFT_1385981 [Mycena capillaripes]|nr:hypothetical protein B0H19DRAFT_1385981 [Mycena capillaripes]
MAGLFLLTLAQAWKGKGWPRLPDVTASPPSAARSRPSFTDATSLVVLKQRSAALKALEAGKARNSPPGSAARRRCFAERDASKLENGGRALGSTICPRSPRRCFTERNARPLRRREALDRLLERVCDRLKGEIVRADVSTSSLLPLYLEGRDPLRGVLATWRRYAPDTFCGMWYADTRTGATLLQPVAPSPPTKAN